MLFTPHGCQVRSPKTRFFLGGSIPSKFQENCGYVCRFTIFLGGSVPSKSQESCGEVQVLKKYLEEPVLQNTEKPRRNPSFEKFSGPLKIVENHRKIQILKPVHCGKTAKNFLDEPALQNPEPPRKNARLEIFFGPLKIAGNRGKNPILKPVHRRQTTKNPNFETCCLFLAKNFPTGKPSHLPLISPHICLQITKDVQSQRLTVHCHSVGLRTKNEQELGLGLESIVEIIDPSPLLISNRLSKMLSPSSSNIKHCSVCSSFDCLIELCESWEPTLP